MKDFSSSIQRRKCGKRTEYIARLTYYDKSEQRTGVSKSLSTLGEAKRELQKIVDHYLEGGSEVFDARKMTFRGSR